MLRTLARAWRQTPLLVPVVAAALFRAIFLVDTVQSTCVASLGRLTSPFANRLVATVGELHLGYLLSAVSGQRLLSSFKLAVVANSLAWLALLLGQPALHALENSLWAAAVALVLVRVQWGSVRPASPYFLEQVWLLTAMVLWVAFIATTDVPYWLAAQPTWSSGSPSARLLACQNQLPLGSWDMAELRWQYLYYGAVVAVALPIARRGSYDGARSLFAGSPRRARQN